MQKHNRESNRELGQLGLSTLPVSHQTSVSMVAGRTIYTLAAEWHHQRGRTTQCSLATRLSSTMTRRERHARAGQGELVAGREAHGQRALCGRRASAPNELEQVLSQTSEKGVKREAHEMEEHTKGDGAVTLWALGT